MGKVLVRRSVPASSLLTGLVSYWKLDEASGVHYDAVGDNDLTPVGTVTAETGKISNGAQMLVADTSYLTCAAPTGMPADNSSFTIAFWSKMFSVPPAVPRTYLQVVAYEYAINVGGEYYSYGVELKAAPNFEMAWAVFNGFDEKITHAAFTPPPPETWLFFVAWHDADQDQIGIECNNSGDLNLEAYSDGYLAPEPSVPFAIGARQRTNSMYYDGILDEIGIWNRVLTADERAALYNDGDGVTYPFLGV